MRLTKEQLESLDWIDMTQSMADLPDDIGDVDVGFYDNGITVAAKWENGDVVETDYYYADIDYPVFRHKSGRLEGDEVVGDVVAWAFLPDDYFDGECR